MRWLALVSVAACTTNATTARVDMAKAPIADLDPAASDLAGVDLAGSDLARSDLAEIPSTDMTRSRQDLRGSSPTDMAQARQPDMMTVSTVDMEMCLMPLATCTDASQCCNGYGCSSYAGSSSKKCWEELGQPCALDLDCKPQQTGPAPICLDPAGAKICCQWTTVTNGCGAGHNQYCHKCSTSGASVCDPC
jgi:hypothetical protein